MWSDGSLRNVSPPSAFLRLRYCAELGLDVNAAERPGLYPLMDAAWRGNNEIIQFLVDKGAKLDARIKKGWSVTDMANGPALRSAPMIHPETIAFLTKTRSSTDDSGPGRVDPRK